jgi:predicted dehydrogenase
MGSGHCGAIQKLENAELTAVCDIDPATSETSGKKFNVPSFKDHKALIKSKLCDIVVVATPHPAHPEVAIDCMKAGLHVISEKPLSERISTAEKMIRTAKQCKVVLAVMFQRRFEPVMAKAMEIARSGELGEIYRTLMVSPEFRNQFYYDSGTWRATWNGEGGGVMMNQSPHILDLFVQIGGKPSEVFGDISTRMHRIEVEDQALALLKYPNGAIGYLYCSTNEAGPGQSIEVFGEKGKLIYRDGKLSLHRFAPGIKEHIVNADSMWSGPKCEEVPLEIPQEEIGHIRVIRNVVRHILFKEPLRVDAETGLASLELANAITLSSFEKRWVKLPLNEKKYDELLARLRRSSKFVKKNVHTQRTTDPQHLK